MKRMSRLLLLFMVIALLAASTAPDIIYAQNGSLEAGAFKKPDDSPSNDNANENANKDQTAQTDADETGDTGDEATEEGDDSGDTEEDDSEESEDISLKVTPKNLSVAVGETIQFTAELVDNTTDGTDDDGTTDDGSTDDGTGDDGSGEDPEGGTDDGSGETTDGEGTTVAKAAELAIVWSVSDDTIGEIDENGLFTALAEGKVKVIAESDGIKGQTNVTVTGDAEDDGEAPDDNGDSDSDAVVNAIDFYRMLPNGNVTKHGSTEEEGGTKMISGLPSPLNILNGSRLYFPENSLNDNITITIKLPAFAQTNGEEDVEFKGGIVNAVTFEVTVDGEAVSPYYFAEPLELSIPYKTGHMDRLGLAPEDLGMFFANDSGDIEGDPGITDLVLDEASGRITGKVAHFSTIVIAAKNADIAADSGSDSDSGDDGTTDDGTTDGDGTTSDDGTSGSGGSGDDDAVGNGSGDGSGSDSGSGGEVVTDGDDGSQGGESGGKSDGSEVGEDDGSGDSGDDAEIDEDDGEDDDSIDGGEAEDEEDDSETEDGPSLKVYPKRVLAEVGETVKFEAEIEEGDSGEENGGEGEENTEGYEGETGNGETNTEQNQNGSEKTAADVEIVWSVSDAEIGEIDQEGLFTALALGKVTVTATAGDLKGIAHVEVTEDGPKMSPDTNTVSMFRELPNGNVTKYGSRSSENDTINIGGLPYPLNVLNGSKMTIPEGALVEDIELTVVIPEFAKLKETEEDVEFEGRIVAGVKFEVKVEGEVISPYYFEEPLEISIPYKKGLLDNLGITPEDLTMFFANADGEVDPEDPGITDIVVDEVTNTITGRVAHFSNIVVAPKDIGTSVASSEAAVPEAVELMQNSPNPFNPTTTISFTLHRQSDVKLSIYNMVGQEVRTLTSGMHQPGSYSVVWDAKDQRGAAVTSGIYFYRIEAGGITETRKLMLLK